MSTTNPATDKVLVQRSTTVYSTSSDMSTVQDTDLILINRGGTDYKCTFLDWKNSQSKAPDVGTVVLADSPEAGRFTSATFASTVTMTEDGIPASAKGLKAWVEGALKTAALSSAITKVENKTVASSVDLNATTSIVGNVINTHNGGVNAMWDGNKAFGVSSAPADVAIITFSTPIHYSSKVEIYKHYTDEATDEARVNNGTWVSCPTSGNWYTIATGSGRIDTISLRDTSGGNCGFSAIRVDGVELTGTYSDSFTATVLTLTNNTDLAKFTPGDAVTEVGNGDDGTGTVSSVDTTAKTITFNSQEANWDVGSQAKGPLKTQAVTVTPESDEITAVNTSGAQPVLTFKTDKDLANFAGGDFLVQENTSSSPFPNGPTTDTGSQSPTFVNGAIIAFSSTPQVFDLFALAPGGLQVYTSDDGVNWTYVKLISGPTTDSSPSTRFVVLGGSGTNARQIKATNNFTWLDYNTNDIFDKKANCTVSILPSLPFGTVGSVDVAAKTITLATSNGTWGPANAGHYVIGPTKTSPAANVKLYTVHDAAGAVSDLQSADPGFVTMTGNSPYTLTFPATLPSGNAPDADLPAGTTLTTEVQATNASGSDTGTSNTITPA